MNQSGKTGKGGTHLNFFFRSTIRALIFGAMVFANTFIGASADGADPRNALWEIVTTCLDSTITDYCLRCRWPKIEATCPYNRECKNTTELWAESEDYVIIRDRKMCGCPEGFVHGLAIPRTRVTGVEDPNLPDGIWRFAWAAAQKTISDEAAIALVVNPARLRSQDQLHVHILRLGKDARQRLDGLPASRLRDLDEVWRTAKKGALDANLNDYGVLVAGHPDGGFMVRVEKGSPEWLYTEGNCQ